jgi:hypothetical protein
MITRSAARLRRLFFFLSLSCMCFLRVDAAETAFKAKHVILLVLDGERYSETWGAVGRENIPRSANELAPQGTMLTHCINDGMTYTLPGHCSLLTGHNEELPGNEKDLPQHPSIFQLLVAKGARPDEAWLVTSKEKLHVLTDCAAPEWKGRFLARTDCGLEGVGSGNRDDADTMLRVQSILQEYKPRFMAINLKDPDICGHKRDWDGYLKSIYNCDALAANLWEWIQSKPAFANQTALIITNDHGRHIDGRMEGFISHGDGCSGCRHIGFLALGPDFRRNAVVHTRHTQSDIAATIARLLGVELDRSEGEAISELWVEAPSPSATAAKN